MPAKKKNFTAADEDAVSKIFFPKGQAVTAADAQPPSTRGKRTERLGLLLDEQLKEELELLYKATNGKSINDLIVNVLIGFVEREENQTRLKQYRALVGDVE